MKHKRYRIKRYGWTLDIYYFATKDDAPVVINELFKMGADDEALYTALHNIGKLNHGLMYTDINNQHSVIIVSITSSFSELANTLAHELNHVCSHIEEVYDIDAHGEEACYLLGGLVETIINQI